MIMNKKIFTLLTSVLLMLGAVFTANAADPSVIAKQKLQVGNAVDKLNTDAKLAKYYHLKIDSIANLGAGSYGIDAASANTLNSSLVLLLKDTLNTHMLYVDSINTTRPDSPSNQAELLKTQKSASSLWCVHVDGDNLGANNIFDFVNKEYDETLDVDVYGYENWGNPKSTGALGGDTAWVPGGISGWHFSEIYYTGLDHKVALYSYITHDTVAVLAIDGEAVIDGNKGFSTPVIVKVVHVNDVKDVAGLLLFTLAEAKLFVLDAEDINYRFGKDDPAKLQKLTLDPTVAGANHPDVFADGIFASNIVLTDTGLVEHGKKVSGAWLDSLGYLNVAKKVAPGYGDWLMVDTSYYSYSINQGDRYLRLVFKGDTVLTDVHPGNIRVNDSLMWPQRAFRFVYDPSEDNIKINAYKATYWPEDFTTLPLQLINAYDKTLTWADSGTQAWYTFVADTNIISKTPVTTFNWFDTMTVSLNGAAATLPERQALKNVTGYRINGDGTQPTWIHPAWQYFQKLYVSVQDLTNATRIQTLLPKSNNRTYFDGLYTPCSDLASNGNTSVPIDLYLIRNEKGEYLRVPLHSATDSCEWEEPAADEHPELIPSYQWVVERRYTSGASPVTLVNREFPWLKFENVQLKTESGPFVFRDPSKIWHWNHENVNSRVIALTDVNSDKTATFIKLDAKIKGDKYLGYTWIDPDSAIINLYALNYYNKLDASKYIGWKGSLYNYPNTDTTLQVNYSKEFDKMFFRLDTIRSEAGYGSLNKYGYEVLTNSDAEKVGIVNLERQPYRLTYEDPLKYRCINTFSIVNGEDQTYAVAPKGTYKAFIGRPVFYLRNSYYRNDANGNLEPYFALVQTLDTTSILDPDNHEMRNALNEYLTSEYGPAMALKIMEQLEVASTEAHKDVFNPALFVAAVDEQTTTLKVTLRAEAQTRISTFRLEKDTDPIYRRFDQTSKEGVGDGDEQDAPKTVHFHQYNLPQNRLYENTGYLVEQRKLWTGLAAANGERHYLGEVNINQPGLGIDGQTVEVNTNIYVDTAYVNRGTGYIKPQYMLVVRPEKIEPAEACDPSSGEYAAAGETYLRGYYLINAYDSAHSDGKLDARYLWNTQWERFIFVDAVHARDRLFIIEGLSKEVLKSITYADGETIDLDKLEAAALATNPKVKSTYLGNNNHKDCVVSFRLIERFSNDFIIESESTDRDTIPMIKPCEGGWLKIQNNVPVISRAIDGATYLDAMGESAVFNVIPGDGPKSAQANEEVEVAKVTVVGDAGSVTILGAAGKKVVLTNLLGQTITNTVLTSDNATVPAPSGIVIVSVAGEKAVQALVK
jgi:hypothetical protein